MNKRLRTASAELAALLRDLRWRPRTEAGPILPEARRYLFQECRGGALILTDLGLWLAEHPDEASADWIRGLVPDRTRICAEEGELGHPEMWGSSQVWAALLAEQAQSCPADVAAAAWGDLFSRFPPGPTYLGGRERLPLIHGALWLRDRTGISLGSEATCDLVSALGAAGYPWARGASQHVTQDPYLEHLT
jgi:hypothetical protein